jgi:adenylylsulfate kinase-like enzyme
MEEQLINKFLEEMILPESNYKKPFIIALCGYSGSGKSFVSRLFSRNLGTYIIAGDKVRGYLYKINYSDNFYTINDLTNKITDLRIKKVLDNNIPVVLDRSISSIEQLEDLKKYNVDIIFIKLNSTHEENIKRILSKKNKEDVKEISGTYGDIGHYSGVSSIELYNEIKDRKVYNIPDNLFDYQINTLDGLKDIEDKASFISSEILKEYK